MEPLGNGVPGREITQPNFVIVAMASGVRASDCRPSRRPVCPDAPCLRMGGHLSKRPVDLG